MGGACQPQTEVCNGADDNCNNQVDEGSLCPHPANGTAACQGGACRLASCNANHYECQGQCVPNSQRCGAACGAGFKACGAGCIANAACCTNGAAGCPAPACSSGSAVTYTCQNGLCVEARQNCGNASNHCVSNQVVRATCAAGTCGMQTVMTCGANQTCTGASCVDNCTAGQSCPSTGACTVGRTTCSPAGCMQVPVADGAVCPGGRCRNGGCVECGTNGKPCCQTGNRCGTGLGCTDGRCGPCGIFHNQPCCGNPGDPRSVRCPGDPSYMGGLFCEGEDNTCINLCGEPNRPCCGEPVCNDGVACPSSGICI
jgi:hypothetical protein